MYLLRLCCSRRGTCAAVCHLGTLADDVRGRSSIPEAVEFPAARIGTRLRLQTDDRRTLKRRNIESNRETSLWTRHSLPIYSEPILKRHQKRQHHDNGNFGRVGLGRHEDHRRLGRAR